MLKYKKYVFPTIADGDEDLTDMLAGMSGKNRRIVSLMATPDDLAYIRVYRDADQIVDLNSFLLTATAPILPMDLPLAEGQLCKVGFYNNTGGGITPAIAIGYEETG